MVLATATLTEVRASATPTPTSTVKATPTATATAVTHIYYLSTFHTAHEYYCDTDPAWHDLDPQYLAHFSSVADVLRQYPGRTPHAPCE